MKIVLLETVGNLGVTGTVVNVRRGYARNYLFPRQKAILADERSLRQVEHQKRIVEHRMKKAMETAQEAQRTLEAQSITITRKSGDNERLFGSVTAMDIENCLSEKGIEISRRTIALGEPIKKLGSYKIPVKLAGGLEAKISLEVKAEEN